MLFKTDFFKLLLSQDKLDIESNENIAPQTPSALLRYSKLLLALATGSGSIQVSSKKHPLSSTLKIPDANQELDADACRNLVKMCELTISVLNRVGIADEPMIDISVITGNADRIGQLHSLLNPEGGPTKLSFKRVQRAVSRNN